MSAHEFDQLMKLCAAVVLFVAGLLVLRRRPRLTIVGWTMIIAFVPIWVGVSAIAFFPAASVISLFVAFSLLPRIRLTRLTAVDLLLAGILVIVLIEFTLGLTTLSATFDMITLWASSYVVGRLITPWARAEFVYRTIAVVFTVVAVLALIEFATGQNLFIDYLANGTDLFATWGTLQPRGGVLRAEGAFGHSIALGASLGIAVALTLGSSLRSVLKLPMVALMSTAALVTFSRTGIATCVLAIVLCCLCQRENLTRAFRIGVLLLTGVAAVIAYTLVNTVFLESGNEAENSALYRTQLLNLVTTMSPFGLSTRYHVSASGQVSIGDFGSIDNALLLFGLIYGWVPLVLVLCALAGALGYTLRRRATPAVLAVVAQIPAMVTVALITQYAAMLWFVVGLAVGTQVAADRLRRAAAESADARPAVPSPTRSPAPVLRGEVVAS